MQFQYFGKEFDIYCFGMPNETPENLVRKIRENEKTGDWTVCFGNFTLERMCVTIIENSKIIQKECEKYNIRFFDMAGEREEKIKEAVNVIVGEE